ncbi:UNVERIFIED_CONTAM: hypothetical protein FKN15_056696 [Acipenser sinensis]
MNSKPLLPSTEKIFRIYGKIYLGRMSFCEKRPTEENNEYTDSQENELEALASIYGEDFQDLRKNLPWKGLTSRQETYVTIDLWVQCPPTYPDVPPEVELKNAKGLSTENLQNLQSELKKLAADLCGEVMIFQLAEHVQCFLSEHNIPPPKSFHEEMLKNQQRQQEKLAQEQQQRIDQQRKREEQMQNEILAEIQRREEEKKEEKKRKEMAKQKMCISCSVSRRDRQHSCCSNEESTRPLEVLQFSAGSRGDITVYRGKCIGESEQLGRRVYHAFEATSGDFVIVYEWILQWNKKMGKFFTSQEKDKIEKCKKQIQGAESELNSLLKLDHPNLVHYTALTHREHEDSIVINLLAEHINGSSLSSSLSKSTPLPIDQIRNYASQLLTALDFLHSNSVVHKVLSAASVLVDSEGNVKLTDYSISKRLAEICKEDIFEQTRVRFCEDALPRKTGKKGDVWNLGLLLLALSQGKEVKQYPLTVPSSLPSDFQDFLHKLVKTQARFGTRLRVLSKVQVQATSRVVKQSKVQNKLDGCSYAVKRIQVNPASKQFRRIKGEVTLLSRLNHENIVRYYNAWIEKQQMPSSGVLSNESSEQKTSNASPPQDKVNELGLMDNVEDNAPPPALASSVEWSTTVEKSSSAKRGGEDQESSDDEDVFCASFRAYNSDSDSDIIFANGDGSRDGHSQKTAVAQLAKQGMKDLEEVTGLLKKLGVKLQVVINLGLFYKVQHHSGIIFQFVAFVKRRHRTVPDIVAAGGRYDHLIPQFRGPELSGPIPSAVGASLALEKICAALASMEEPPSISCCDMLVVSVGQTSMDRAIKILQKLWTAGVSADVMYDVSQSQETVQEHCKHVGIACAAFVSEKEGNYIKVKSFEKDRQSEKRILETDLVDHLIQKFKTKFSDDRFTR